MSRQYHLLHSPVPLLGQAGNTSICSLSNRSSKMNTVVMLIDTIRLLFRLYLSSCTRLQNTCDLSLPWIVLHSGLCQSCDPPPAGLLTCLTSCLVLLHTVRYLPAWAWESFKFLAFVCLQIPLVDTSSKSQSEHHEEQEQHHFLKGAETVHVLQPLEKTGQYPGIWSRDWCWGSEAGTAWLDFFPQF